MFCKIKGSDIFYEQYGEGMPVLCIHGFPEDHRSMKGCMEPIFEQKTGYRRIYIDLPGMGRSPVNENVTNADDMLDILIFLIEKLIGSNPFLLASQSYGCYLCLGLIYSKRYENLKGFLFICPCLKPYKKCRNLPEKHVVRREEIPHTQAEEPVFLDFLEYGVVISRDSWKRYLTEIQSGLKKADIHFTEKYQRQGYAFSFDLEIVKLTFNKPSCVILGRQDHCVGYSDQLALLSDLPRTTFGILDSGGHNLQIELQPIFDAFVLDWICRIESEKN